MKLRQNDLIFFWIILFLFSMVYSKFLLSISMFGLGFSALFPLDHHSGRPRLRKNLKSKAKQFFQSPTYFSFSLLIVAYLISGLYSSDLGEWFWRVRTKSPFLFIPLAFFLFLPFGKMFYDKVLAFFVLLMTLSTSWILVNYFLHQDAMVELLRVGQAIPTPCHHIRYSMMVALAGMIASYALLFGVMKNYKRLWWPGFVILFLAIHVLSVRTGLITFYLGLLSLATAKIFSRGNVWAGALTIIFILSAPFLAYFTLPSFKQKVDYVKYDREQFEKNDGQNYSDSERIMSLEAGWHTFQNKPWLGVGMGDLRHEMAAYYLENFNRENWKFPHNQFLFVLAGCGILGTLIFLMGLTLPIILAKPLYRPLFVAMALMILASFMVETTVETAVGTAITVFWLTFFVQQDRDLSTLRKARSHGDDTTVE